jgi:hypothetical protein
LTAYIDFHGDGKLHGSGYLNRGGITPVPYKFTGTYTVTLDGSTTPDAFSGVFHLVDAGGVDVQYFWVMSDNWHRLEFSALSSTLKGENDHPPLAAGTLVKLRSPLPVSPLWREEIV